MANSLGEDLEIGTIVIVDQNLYDVDDLRFRVSGGFGRLSSTTGSSVSGVWLEDDEKDNISGHDIDPVATRNYWEQHGRFV